MSSSVHMYFQCLFLLASLVIHHSNMLSEEQWPQKPHIPHTKHSCHCISVAPSTIENRNKIRNCSSFLRHSSINAIIRSWSSPLVAGASQKIHISCLPFLKTWCRNQTLQRKSRQTTQIMLPFLLLFIMIQPWWTSRWKIHSFLNVEDDDAPFTLTTSLGLPKAQWKRITNRLPTLQENLWNLSVWADKRRTYNFLPTEGANIVGKWVPDRQKLGLNEEWRAKKSHKKFNLRITFPATANMHNL